MLPIRSLSCSPTSSPRLQPRRSLSSCDHYDLTRNYLYCSSASQSPSINEAHIYENSSVTLKNCPSENDPRNIELARTKDKHDILKQNKDRKQNMNTSASFNSKTEITSADDGDHSESKKSNPQSESVIQSSEKIISLETGTQSSSSDDTLVDQDSSSRDSSHSPSSESLSTARPSATSNQLCQTQSVTSDKSIGKSETPTFIRNSKIDGCQNSTDTYRKSTVPKTSLLLRQSLNSQNMIDSNRTDADLTKSPELALRNSNNVDLKSIHSSLVNKSLSGRHPMANCENKNLYQTFSNQYVSSPKKQRHVRINPADLAEYDKRDSISRFDPHEDPNIYKQSPICYRKSKENSHAEQINELNRRMTKSQYSSPGSSRNLYLDRNSLIDGKVYKSRPASLHPEFSSVSLEPIYSNGMSPTLTPRTSYVRRHSSLRSESPTTPMMNARSSTFVKYPTFGYFLPAMNYYQQDVLGYYAPASNSQW